MTSVRIDDDSLLIGQLRLPLMHWNGRDFIAARTQPDRPLHPWSPLEWIVNKALSGSRPDFRHAIESGEAAGDGEISIDPLTPGHDGEGLKGFWTEQTGLPAAPSPMVLDTCFARGPVLVPLPILQAILAALEERSPAV